MATPLTYRQWLQMKANDTSGQVPTDVTYSNLLLQIAGNDGKLDGYAVGENRRLKGNDGEIYSVAGRAGDFKDPGKGLMDVNDTMYARYNAYANNPSMVSQVNQESEGFATGGGGGGVVNYDPDAAERNTLRGRIRGRAGEIDSVYNSLFSDLDNLLKARSGELDTQYTDQLSKASSQYADFLPKIEDSYASLGSANSTDLRDANIDAKTGYEDTVSTIGKNKEKDQAALGQYGRTERAKFKADQGAAKQSITESEQTTDVGALRSLATDLDRNIRQAGVTSATLGTDGAARKDIQGLTADGGRYEQAVNALDSILNSSLSGDVKSAAIQAVSTSVGLNDDEQKKIQQQYGNVYAEQAAL